MVIGQIPLKIRDRSLDTMRGMGATNKGGMGQVKFTATKKVGAKKVLPMLK